MPYIHKMQSDKPTEGVYLVYRSSGGIERVAANTASEALEKSTVENPVRVLRYDPLSQTLLQGDDFNFQEDIAVEEAVVQQDAAPEDAVANEEEPPAPDEADATPDAPAES